MSQSRSLIAALEAVDRVLSADASDLRTLAEVAEISPDQLFLKADLTGVDLRNQDIEFLLPLEVDYVGAKLTDEQIRRFRRAERLLKKDRLTANEIDLRLEKIHEFIAFCTDDRRSNIGIPGRQLNEEDLFYVFVEPFFKYINYKIPLDTEYINFVLSNVFILFEKPHNEYPYHYNAFFKQLFSLFNFIKSPIDSKTIEIIDRNLRPLLSDTLGEAISLIDPSDILDTYWIRRNNFKDSFSASMQIGNIRNVDTQAIENTLHHLTTLPRQLSWEEVIWFLGKVPYSCTTDQAERLATFVVLRDWPPRNTKDILEAEVRPNLRTAIFRQILGQGDEGRVVELIKWLNDNRGAIGVLSLENAFQNIQGFNPALQLAYEIADDLADNQLDAIVSQLERLVETNQHSDRLKAFIKRHIPSSLTGKR